MSTRGTDGGESDRFIQHAILDVVALRTATHSVTVDGAVEVEGSVASGSRRWAFVVGLNVTSHLVELSCLSSNASPEDHVVVPRPAQNVQRAWASGVAQDLRLPAYIAERERGIQLVCGARH